MHLVKKFAKQTLGESNCRHTELWFQPGLENYSKCLISKGFCRNYLLWEQRVVRSNRITPTI